MRGIVALAVAAGILAGPAAAQRREAPDSTAIRRLADALAADSMRGRGPWSPEATEAARFLADQLRRLGARPLVGPSLLVPFTVPERPADTVFNVVAFLPPRRGSTDTTLVGLTAHLDHLGVDSADATGDSIYNGFLDDAIGDAMVLDVARRYAAHPGDRGLAVFFFNLEEQGLLGSLALIRDTASHPALRRLVLMIGVDAGAPAGEALDWELIGALPAHPAALLADSLARLHGWTTRATPPRPISDAYLFARVGIPILFPIPGASWRGYSSAGRDSAMARFDHYHQPADQPQAAFPMVGTAWFAEWLWEVVQGYAGPPSPRS
ncbi:MAG TPA: M28 family peptidase [Gemmatimonadales bacterium]|nr:M28 family peptidase [Gemmatimonadales bacterium]